tara:strand:- start:1359 stop:2219 length:861 start_codon:yes stop_codon:yes gene_type:complete
MAGKRSVSSTLFEHSTESLPAVSTTAQLEGDTIAATAANNTVRNSNQCQILYRSAAVTGTEVAIDRAGVNDAMAHQLSIMSRALKRDVEKLMLGNSVVNTGAASTARTSAGILAKLATNISKASNGANPTAAQAAVGSTARTDGTARAFTEALLKAVLKLCYDNSGDQPTQVIMSSANKQLASAFSGRASATQVVALPGKADEVNANVSLYSGDFGVYAMQADRFIRGEKDVLVINPDYAKVSQLRAFETQEIGRTGDALGKYIIWEGGLQIDNELAHGLVGDCGG